jgi:hypothetical protein
MRQAESINKIYIIMETLEYKGISINLILDETASDPRKEFDNLGTMVCFHNRYNLGDDHNWSSVDDFRQFLKQKHIVWLPLYLYDHSGITMNTSGFTCHWDSGQVGAIYFDMETFEDHGFSQEWIEQHHNGKTKEEIMCAILEGEVETYDHFISGDVYGYKIKESDDSCFGFYGNDHRASGLLEYAENSIDCYLKEKAIQEHSERIRATKKAKMDFAFRKRKKAVRVA